MCGFGSGPSNHRLDIEPVLHDEGLWALEWREAWPDTGTMAMSDNECAATISPHGSGLSDGMSSLSLQCTWRAAKPSTALPIGLTTPDADALPIETF